MTDLKEASLTNVLSIILGGGKGTRLFPLTKDRSKPAVPFGGKYRIVDIPISNCINSGYKQIYILTQFNSASLNLHIARTYAFDSFSRGFCEILSAEQTYEHSGWYDGTADAVRKNFLHFRPQNPSHYIILSGDQLYRMDLRDMFEKHVEAKAEITIACTRVTREDASDLGILKVDANRSIQGFLEKPGPAKNIDEFKIPRSIMSAPRDEGKDYLASMGIYIFDSGMMEESLANDLMDFGKEIIPSLIGSHKINAYVFKGYWEDIGTIRSFYEANIKLTSINPPFDMYDEYMPIYTHIRNLPPSKLNNCRLNQAITAEGCIITNASIGNSIVGVRSIVESGADLQDVVCMGADFYESMEQKERNAWMHTPNVGIGRECIIRGAIIDKNARIGEACRIGVDPKERADGEFGNYYIVDGVIVIPKNAVLAPGTVI
jgi:glucose-1-phosphate adenylyltransferase